MLQLKIHQQPENGIFSYFSPCLINNYHCWAGFTSRIRIILALKVIVLHFNKWAVQRWQRNSTGRPLFPSQNHWKNIWTLSKLHKTTSECWQRTSGTQKSSPLSWKEVGQKIKDKKRDKRVRDGDLSPEGSLNRGEVCKTPGNLLTGGSGESFWISEGNITRRKNK